MDASFLIYSLTIGFAGLFLAGVMSLFKPTFKVAAWLFVLANLANAAAGVSYFWIAGSASLTLGQFDWFFHFAPRLNFLSAIFLTVISAVSALVGVYSMRYLEVYRNTYNRFVTQFLMALFVFGMQAVLLANNVFSFLFFWEVMSVSSFFLVLADQSKESFNAAFFYFIMTHLGASAILGGFLLLGNGSLFFDLAGIKAASQHLSPLLSATAFGLLLFGFGSKAGLVPFHGWLPEAHPQAPSNISALMSGLMLKVAVYGFLTVVLNYAVFPGWAGEVIIALGLMSGLVGALYAALETDVKRALAYSSIENMGIIFTILGLAIELSGHFRLPVTSAVILPLVVFAIFHALSHAFFKTALFLSSGVLIGRVHSRSLELMGGFAKALPWFSGAFLVAIIGSLPIPPFGTFFGEWGLIHAIINLLHGSSAQYGLLPILVLILAVIGMIGGLATFAMVKVFALSSLGLPRAKHHEIKPESGDGFLVWPIAILAAGVLALGVFAQPLLAGLAAVASVTGTIVAAPAISSFGLAAGAAMALLFAYLFNLLFAFEKGERAYHTWDCGQPINSSMEYTASAFSAPIRFFFAKVIGRTRVITSVPVVATNPWIRQYSFKLSIHLAMKETFYEPVSNLVMGWAQKAKLIQSGRIQYYLLLLLATLIIALSIAL